MAVPLTGACNKNRTAVGRTSPAVQSLAVNVAAPLRPHVTQLSAVLPSHAGLVQVGICCRCSEHGHDAGPRVMLKGLKLNQHTLPGGAAGSRDEVNAAKGLAAEKPAQMAGTGKRSSFGHSRTGSGLGRAGVVWTEAAPMGLHEAGPIGWQRSCCWTLCALWGQYDLSP